jgi:hypothetical protein
MKRWLFSICSVAVVAVSPLAAQESVSVLVSQANQVVPEVAPMLPDDAPYERYETARQLIQRKAALKGAQRRARIANNKALGYSPLRPTTSPTAFTGSIQTRPGVVRYTPFPGTFYWLP